MPDRYELNQNLFCPFCGKRGALVTDHSHSDYYDGDLMYCMACNGTMYDRGLQHGQSAYYTTQDVQGAKAFWEKEAKAHA